MKKYLLLLLMVTVGTGLYAQQARQLKNYAPKKVTTVEPAQQMPMSAFNGTEVTNRPYKATPFTAKAAGVKVGETKYDLQTNSSCQRRVVQDADGTSHVIWTMARKADFSDRGTGYNTVAADGTVGNIPTQRFDVDRTGWPDISILESGRLVSMAHFSGASDPNNEGLQFSYKDPGDDDWTSARIGHGLGSNTWVRTAAAGTTVYAICSQFGAQACDVSGGLQFFRSSDEGATWDLQGVCVDFMDEETVPDLGGDIYAIDARGDKVAFVTGASQAVLFTSEDRGETWTFKRLNEMENPFWSGAEGESLDYTVVSDGSYSLVIDNNGVVHVWYGRELILDDDPAAGWSYFPGNTAIMYWNSSWADDVQPKALGKTVRQDADGDSIFFFDLQVYEARAYFSALVSMPSGGVDADGNLYLAFRSIVEGQFDANDQYLSEVMMVKSTDGGSSWVGPINVSNSAETEDVFPSIPARIQGDKIPVVYLSDMLASTNLQGADLGFDHDVVDNEVMFVEVGVDEIVDPENPAITAPQLLAAAFTTAIQGCAYSDPIVFAIDYPDGELEPELGGEVFDNLDNVGGCFDLIISVTDSDGLVESNEFTAEDELCVNIIADEQNPFIILNPYEILDTDSGTFIFSDPLFEDIDVVQGAEWTPLGADIFDDAAVFGCEPTLTFVGEVDTNTPGAYEICYEGVDFADKPAEPVCRTINVVPADVLAPELFLFDLEGNEMASGDTLFFEASQELWEDPGYQAFDRVDLNLTDSVSIGGDAVDLLAFGTYVVEYTVADAAGNSASATRVVVVADNKAPSLSIPGSKVDAWLCSQEFTFPNTTAFDEVDGELTDQLTLVIEMACEQADGSICRVAIDEVPANVQGTMFLTYTVSDASGNEASDYKEYRLYDTGGACPQWCETEEAVAAQEQVCITGIADDLLDSQIKLYPNPTTGIFNVELMDVAGNVQVDVFDAAGKRVANEMATNPRSIQLDITENPVGIYMIKVTTDEGTAIRKVILDK